MPGGAKPAGGAEAGGVIVDETATNLVSLRRTIYLTIQSALDFEEAAHKLLKMQLKPGQEVLLMLMLILASPAITLLVYAVEDLIGIGFLSAGGGVLHDTGLLRPASHL